MATVDERALAGAGQDRARASAERSGMVVPRVFSTEGVSPYDQVDWDLRAAEIKDERGPGDLPADRLRGPQGPGASWPRTWWRASISTARSTRPERETSVRQLVDRVTRTHRRLGTRGRLLRLGRGRRAVLRRADGPLPEPVRLVQLARLVQRRACTTATGIEGAANNWRWDEETRSVVKATSAYQYPQGSACFIQSVSRRHGGHHAAGHGRGDAVQVRLGDGHRPLDAAVEQGEARRRRPAVRARSASCGSTTRSPASSSRAARPAAPPRCRRSRSGTPTSSTSSSARRRRSGRPRP